MNFRRRWNAVRFCTKDGTSKIELQNTVRFCTQEEEVLKTELQKKMDLRSSRMMQLDPYQFSTQRFHILATQDSQSVRTLFVWRMKNQAATALPLPPPFIF